MGSGSGLWHHWRTRLETLVTLDWVFKRRVNLFGLFVLHISSKIDKTFIITRTASSSNTIQSWARLSCYNNYSFFNFKVWVTSWTQHTALVMSCQSCWRSGMNQLQLRLLSQNILRIRVQHDIIYARLILWSVWNRHKCESKVKKKYKISELTNNN